MPRSAALLRFALALWAGLVLASCGTSPPQSDGPGKAPVAGLPGDATPRAEPKSRYGNGRDLGNGPQYQVFDKTYTVMASSHGYQERGVASWYGSKFHGNLTSNREPYDMYAMTAAHKTLPLPTYVRVRNLRNDKEIVVRVNDRGPFVHNRIIDLSYAAALKLDMVQDGTSLVEVTAINFDSSGNIVKPGEQPVLVSTPAVPAAGPEPVLHKIYVQVGAFGERNNAERRLALLQQSDIPTAAIHDDHTSSQSLYRVRIGPVADVAAYDQLVNALANIGINDPYLISE